jgi:hypothetical protein
VNKIIALCVFLFAVPASAQTRILAGASGGELYNNASIGLTAGIEQPITKHFEADLYETFSPIEWKGGIGHGVANNVQVGGIAWLTNSLGATGNIQHAQYWITPLQKSAWYAEAGPIIRLQAFGTPSRFSVLYEQQIKNGISDAGIETSHLHGVAVVLDSRLVCATRFCVRMRDEWEAGAVLQQGNPRCDGSLGLTGGFNGGPCPRARTISGGFFISLSLEFPRHEGNNAF